MKKCIRCGNDFEPKKPKTVYCTDKCRTYAYRERQPKKVEILPPQEVYDGPKIDPKTQDEPRKFKGISTFKNSPPTHVYKDPSGLKFITRRSVAPEGMEEVKTYDEYASQLEKSNGIIEVETIMKSVKRDSDLSGKEKENLELIAKDVSSKLDF